LIAFVSFVLDVAGGAVMARTGPLDYHDIG
jgi:hypothetical protein